MGFIDNLTKITGIEEQDGIRRLIGTEVWGSIQYLNSGTGLTRIVQRDTLDFESAGEGVNDFFRSGKRFNPTYLNMPANCLAQGPHCHPGGEFAYVVQGEYFDADMKGNSLRTYPAGSTIFYNKGSTHRPLSKDGAQILYIPFDGVVFGKDGDELLRKMIKIATPVEAVEYALHWLEPSAEARKEIMLHFAALSMAAP